MNPGPDSLPAAEKAIANIMSGWGIVFAIPPEVVEMIKEAMALGYAMALEDVRDAKFDGRSRCAGLTSRSPSFPGHGGDQH